jgi:hypothetical protein
MQLSAAPSPFSASSMQFRVASMLVTRSGSGMSGTPLAAAQQLDLRDRSPPITIKAFQSRSRHSSSQKMRTHPKYNSRTTRQSLSRLLAQTTCSSACTAPGPRSTFFSTCVPSSTRVPSPYLDLADSRSGGCHTTVDIAISGKVPDTAPASVGARRRVCTPSCPTRRGRATSL